MLRARSLLSRVLVSCSCVFILWFGLVRIWIPFMGRPAFLFRGEGKARVTAEEKEKNKRGKKASKIAGSFFSFIRVSLIL